MSFYVLKDLEVSDITLDYVSCALILAAPNGFSAPTGVLHVMMRHYRFARHTTQAT